MDEKVINCVRSSEVGGEDIWQFHKHTKQIHLMKIDPSRDNLPRLKNNVVNFVVIEKQKVRC